MRRNLQRWVGMILFALIVQMMVGCAGETRTPGDPWEGSNRFFYNFNDGLDKYALKPMADGYVKVVPKPVRQCISRGYDNLEYGDVIVNQFLQGNFDKGCSDACRMLVNSTVGIAGIFDVATPLGLKAHDTDFGITLGKWGFKQGPYIVWPLFGPSTVRDTPGIAFGFLTDPTTWVDIPLWGSIAIDTLEAVDERSRYEKAFRFRNAASLDPYVFTRDAYLQHREMQVNEGKEKPPATTEPSIFDEPDEGASAAPATQAATQPGMQSAAPATTQPALQDKGPATRPAN